MRNRHFIQYFKYLLISLLLGATFQANAQTIVWQEDFESATSASYTTDQTSITGLSGWSYSQNQYGRLRTAVGAWACHGGNRAATLDASRDGWAWSTNYLTVTIDLGEYSDSENLILSFWFMDHQDESSAEDRICIRRGDDAEGLPWLDLYDLNPSSCTDGVWNEVGNIDIDAVIDAQVSSSNKIQLQFRQDDNYITWSATSNDGITFDDIKITEAPPYQNVSPGLVYWLAGNAGVTGNPVSTWADQSGNGNNATSGNGPTHVTSTDMNNQEVLQFDGTNDALGIANDARINTGGGYNGSERSIFMAFRTGGNINTTQYLYEQGGGVNGLGIFIKNSNLYVTVYNGSAASRITNSYPVSTETEYILSLVWDNGTLTAKLNNDPFTSETSVSSMNTISEHSGGISIAYTDGTTRDETGTQVGGGFYFSGQIAEMLYYDKALTEVEELEINNTLIERYGIDVSVKKDIYYSYESGSWDDVGTWTHDPGGTTQTASDIPKDDSWVVILPGRTVSLVSDVATLNMDVTIRENGTLNQVDKEFTNGLKALRGNGTHRLASLNYPTVPDADNEFVMEEGGTTEYNLGGTYILPASMDTYCHLRINAAGAVATQLHDITLNGDLHIQAGTYSINDNNPGRRKIIINGNVSVDLGATLTVGLGSTIDGGTNAGGTAPYTNYYITRTHHVEVWGDFTNEGTVRFSNQAFPVYNNFSTNGAATVYFMGATNNTLTCKNTTIFYNLVLDKGIDRTYKLTVYSTAYDNFRLYGRNDLGGENWGANPDLRKALWIRTGTLELKGLTIIPSLVEGNDCGSSPNSDYFVPANGALLLSGSEVVVLSTADDYREINIAYNVNAINNSSCGVRKGSCTSFSILGLLQIDNGYFSTRESGGVITWSSASGQFEINGGLADLKQFRSETSGAGMASYIQTGGELLLRGRLQRIPIYGDVNDFKDFSETTLVINRSRSGTDASFGTFNLDDPANVFGMSGGTIRIYDNCGDPSDNGTNTFEVLSSSANIDVSGGTIEIVPIDGSDTDPARYDITTTAPFGNLIIRDEFGTPSIPVQLNTYGLTVLDDLHIQKGIFNANNLDVTIGGDLTIEPGTVYNPGNNWTIFNGNADQNLNISNPLNLSKLKIDKPAGTSLTIGGAPNTITVSDNLWIENATLNDNGHLIQFSASAGTGEVYNTGLHIGAGQLELTGSNPITIEGDGNGFFTNITLNNTNASQVPVSINENITLDGTLTFSNDKLFGINTHKLIFTENASVIGAGASRFIQTSGNASDGGVLMSVNSVKTYSFPIGVGNKYTPVQMGITNYSDDGYVQIAPVDEVLATTNSGGGEILSYYWRVKHQDFSDLPNAEYQFVYDQSDVPSVETGYVQGKVLDESPYTRSIPAGAIDIGTNTLTYSSTKIERANYTAGETGRFGGDVLIYYTRDFSIEPPWRHVSAWTRSDILVDIDGNGTIDEDEYHDSRQPASGDWPDDGDVAVIGWVPWGNTTSPGDEGSPHGIRLRTTITCAELVFSQMKDAAGNPVPRVYRSNFQFRPTLCINAQGGDNGILITNMVRGEGMFWNRGSAPNYDLMDITEFAHEDSAYVLYENFTPNRTYNNTPPEFPNLMLSNDGWGTRNHDVTFTRDIVTTGNLEILGDIDLVLNNGATGDFTVGRDIVMYENMGSFGGFSGGGAEIEFQNNGQVRTITVYGDIINRNTNSNSDDGNGGIIRVANPNTSNPRLDHNLILYGSYFQNSVSSNWEEDGLYLYTGDNRDKITLYLRGDEDAIISKSSGDDPVLYRLIVDKGNSHTSQVEITTDFTLGGPTSGAGVSKALEMRNGTLQLNHNGININLNTGDDNFEIPGTACLQVTRGEVNVSGNSTGIYLDGKLLIDGGTVDMINGAGDGNNYIEYTASGNSEIEVSSGTLNVGSQIRRGLVNEAGMLKYNQTGGNVNVGVRSIGNAGRAKFEILNAGSEFNMDGGNLTIVRGGGNGTFGDLYLRPASSSVNGGTIIFNPDIANSDQDYLLDANVSINNLTIQSTGGGGEDANVTLLVSPLHVKGNLRIEDNNSKLDANSTFNIPITISGDFHNDGDYVHHKNLTTFSGGTQLITGTSEIEFYDLDVEPVTSLTLNKDASIHHDLLLDRGILKCETFTVHVAGDVTNNASYTDTNTGLMLNGTQLQYLSGTGRWGRLELNNSAGARLLNAITLDSDFRLSRGILDINRYLFTLGEGCDILGSGFSNVKMITSDGAFSNVGIKKILSDTDDGTTFFFPLGTTGKYTPAELNITTIGTTGSLRVNNINDRHPATVPPRNVLNYFWDIESEAISGFEGSLVLNYLDEDTAAGIEAKFLDARLMVPTTNWQKGNTSNVDEDANTITFIYNSGTDNLTGEYTAGEDPSIPNQVPEYETTGLGTDWTNKDNWTPTNGTTYPCPAGGPNGFIVHINHEIVANDDHCQAYKTYINDKLVIDNSHSGHNLGTIYGNGTLYMENGRMPAGRYDDFLDCSSDATLEYGGTGLDYTIIADFFTAVPNMVLSGTGSRTLPAIDLLVCKKLEINGPTAINGFNKKLTIQGTMERYGTGAFNSGTGLGATVCFSGSASQSIGGALGDFSGTNAFNNLQIDNPNGLTINNTGAIEVKGNLLLTNGIISTTSTNTLSITNDLEDCVFPMGGNASSYIDGPLTKYILAGDGFDYPIGKGNQVGNKFELTATQALGGSNLWTAEYMTPNTSAGNMQIPLTYVNADEYWKVSSVNGNKAKVNLDWDASSDLTPLMTSNGLSDMRVADFNHPDWYAITSTATGNNSNGTVTSVDRITIPPTGSDDFTIGCIDIVKPRAQLIPGDVCGNTGIEIRFTYSSAIPFDYLVEYSVNGGATQQIIFNAASPTPYLIPTLVPGTYKLERFVYDNDNTQQLGVVDHSIVNVYELPTTADIGNDAGADDDDISDCGGSSVGALPGNNPAIGTGLWTIISGTGGSFVSPTQYDTEFNGTNGTTYELEWKITNGTCESSDTMVVSFPLLAAVPEDFIASKTPVCQGEAGVVYTVPNDPSVTYQWTFNGAIIAGETGNSISLDFADDATTGTLSVLAINGCSPSVSAREMTVTVNPSPKRNLSVSDDVICSGETASITVSNIEAGVNYQLRKNTDNSLQGAAQNGTAGSNLTFMVTPTETTEYNILADPGTGCPVQLIDISTVTVYEKPTTGPVYHVPNNWGF